MTQRIEAQAAALAEGAAHESEARYRALFDTLIEGFCTIEMIFDVNGEPVDYRFLEINPAFEKQTGLYNAQGRLMRDLAPNHEAHWFDIYGKVALTGEPVHFENEAKALGRHFDVRAYRVGGPESRKVVYAAPTGLRILVVDDDPVLLKSLRDTLEGDGHTIVAANGGQEGIDGFRAALNDKQTFDAVVTDLGMPYIDGRQVASFVKAASPSTPVILLTGWGRRLVTEGDLPAHVDLLLSKPPKLREIRDALARCCEARNPNP
jgi:CheY-like chemotaxis protein